jgi:hypothetical protein
MILSSVTVILKIERGDKMKNKLYEFRIIHSSPINRDLAVKNFKLLKELKEKTAPFIRLCKLNNFHIREELLSVVKFAKKEYQISMHTSTTFFLKRHNKNANILLEETNLLTLHNLYTALRDIKESIKESRRRARRISGHTFIHSAPNYWFNKQIEKAFDDKRPHDAKKYFGIELECIIPVDTNLNNELWDYRKFVSIADDGSIDCDSENRENGGDDDDAIFEGKEIRVLVDRDNLVPVLTGVTKKLVGLGAFVNKSCGLHVHFDLRDSTDSERELVYTKLYHSLSLLYSIVPSSRRRNTYCKRNTSGIYKENTEGSRYKAINVVSYEKHDTFEVRLFGGTLDAEKIINWIELLEGIITGSLVLRCPTSFENAQKYWHFSDEVWY